MIKQHGLLRFAFIWATAAFALITAPASAIVVYVDDDAPPGGDGMSWNTAYKFLHDAMVYANDSNHDVTELRIAQGQYRPDQSEANPTGSGDIGLRFEFPNYDVIGGYAGGGTVDPDARDSAAFETILTGDLLGDDQNSFHNFADNSLILVRYAHSIDGCTIRSALKGVLAQSTLTNCRLIQNWTAIDGDQEFVSVSNCAFDHNKYAMENGGGAAIAADHCTFSNHTGEVIGLAEAAAAIFQDCSFTDNKRGVVRLIDGSGISFDRCTFSNNSAPQGAVAYIPGECEADFTSCFFEHNSAQRGGVIYGDATFQGPGNYSCINCIFLNNSASQAGGAIYSYQSIGTIINCTLVHNSAPGAGGIFNSNLSTLKVYNSILKGNSGGSFGGNGTRIVRYSDIGGGHPGVGNIDVDPKFKNVALGDLRLKSTSKCIDAGRKSYVPASVTTDIAGNPRFVDDPNTPDTGVGTRAVDMGAYEFQPH